MADCTHEPPCTDFGAHRKRQRTEWRQAQSARNKQLRNQRARRKPRAYQPGMNRIQPKGHQ